MHGQRGWASEPVTAKTTAVAARASKPVHVAMSSTLKSPSTEAAAAASPRAAKGQALSTGNMGHSGSAASISIDGASTPKAASALREVKKQPMASGSPMARPSSSACSPSRADSSARPAS